MIRLEAVDKRFGSTEALRGASFAVARGEVVGFVGPNGAGKTTALRVLAGYLSPDAGRALVEGFDVERERGAARARVGYLPESAPLPPEMRVEEYLRFRARLKGIARREVGDAVDEAVERARLAGARRRIVGRLSRGFRQRVGLADALVARPPVLLLDEPQSGLDPVQVREFRELLADLARDRAVLLSTHALGEVEAACTRAVVLVGGEVVAEGEPEALRAEVGLPAKAGFEEVFVELSARGARGARDALDEEEA